jgi:hypothetical protein
MSKACKLAFIGVLLAVIPVQKAVLWADETNKTATVSPQSVSYSGKVVVVDRQDNAVTVEIDKRVCKFKISADTVIVSEGKRITLKDLVAGQPVTLELVQAPTGEVLVATATVTSSKSETEAAGPSKRKKRK